MKAIILCAGKGTRLEPLTLETPKTLLPVKDTPILEHILNELPSQISEVFLIVDYLSEKIESFVNEKKDSFPFQINCVQQIADKKGTLAALYSVKPYIKKNERFLVLNGDDLIKKYDLEKIISLPRAFATQKKIMPHYHKVISQNGFLDSFQSQTEIENKNGVMVATGIYILDSDIFDFEPVGTTGSEIGIPQTILKNKDLYPIQTVEFSSWNPINTIEHLEEANKVSQ